MPSSPYTLVYATSSPTLAPTAARLANPSPSSRARDSTDDYFVTDDSIDSITALMGGNVSMTSTTPSTTLSPRLSPQAGADNIHSAASAASPSPHHLSPSSSETPTHSASPSPSPSPRPGLSRTNSVSYFTAEADDSFTGLTLLDALVVLDSHLDLASRNLKKKGLEWKHKAEHTANSVKRQAEEVLNQGRRRTKGLRTSSSYGSELRRRGGSNRTQEEEEDDRIYIDKEVAKLRENVSACVRAGERAGELAG